MENLWTQIFEEANSPSGPLKILTEQKEYLNSEAQFKGKIKCLIESYNMFTVSSSFKLLDDKRESTIQHFENFLSIEAGVKLSFYKQKLIKVASFNVSLLPCEISNCLDENQIYICQNETEFEEKLRLIMQSESIRNTVRNLLLMS